MKVSGARSAPGNFGVLGSKKLENLRKTKVSGARSAPGKWVFGKKRLGNLRNMRDSGARSAPEGFCGIRVLKAGEPLGNEAFPAREARRETLGVKGSQNLGNLRK